MEGIKLKRKIERAQGIDNDKNKTGHKYLIFSLECPSL